MTEKRAIAIDDTVSWLVRHETVAGEVMPYQMWGTVIWVYELGTVEAVDFHTGETWVLAPGCVHALIRKQR